jgi:hypothetical protein
MAIATKFVTQEVGQPRTVAGTITWDLSAPVLKDLTVPAKIHRLDQATANAPILGFSSRVGAPKTVNQVIYFLIRTRRIRDYITLGGSYTTGTSFTISAGDVNILKKGYHLLNVSTREIVRITAAVTSTTITVQRAWGSVASANSIGAVDTMMILGYRSAEGDSKFFDFARFPEVIFNYVGSLQDTYSITNYEDASKKIGGLTAQAKERLERLENMRMRYEKAALFDQRYKEPDPDSGKMVYTPNGLDAICTENEQDFSGTITEATLYTWAENLGRHGPSTRMVMASPKFMRKVSLAASGDRRLTTAVPGRFGMNIVEFQGGPVKLMFFQHPLFFDDPGTASSDNDLNGHAFAIDFNDFGSVTLRGRKNGFFRWFSNVETPGDRVFQEQLVVDYGFTYALAEHYGRGFNVGT